MNTRAKSLLLVIVLVGVAAAKAGAYSLKVSPTVPVERLLRNAERHLRENRSDANAHYDVARLNYMLFSGQVNAVPMVGRAPDNSVWPRPSDLAEARRARARQLAAEEIGRKKGEISGQEDGRFERAVSTQLQRLERENWVPWGAVELGARRAETAFLELGIACTLNPRNSHFRLGRASVADEFLKWSRRVALKNTPTGFQGVNEGVLSALYLEAFRIGLDEAKRRAEPRPSYQSLAAYEAGVRYLELSQAAAVSEKLAAVQGEVAAGLVLIRDWPHGEAVVLQTPLVVCLRAGVSLEELLRPGARVAFDLRGHGVTCVWPWVGPDAGLLVWDPERKAEITSARQLFGGYTFQIARATGYEALAALDDDGDGFLRGEELAGIRVWFDRDGDGRSSRGEVVDLAVLGIVALAVRATGSEGIHPMNFSGAIFADGHTLPTWDWMVAPHGN